MDDDTGFFERLSRGFFDQGFQNTEVVETHISKVFLLDKVVYKFKKPLRLSFLDYSSQEKRRLACWKEFDLGRRFGRELYTRVIFVSINKQHHIELTPVTRDEGLRTDGEYAVEMVRLSSDLMMDHRLLQKQVTDDDLKQIIAHFVACSAQGHGRSLAPEDYLRRLYAHIEDNWKSGEQLWDLDPKDQERWTRLSGLLLMGWARRQSLLKNRALEGNIIEGHGDLRPEHVFLGKPVAFIDPIEFSEDFRTVDRVDELCFLSMECSFLGAEDLAQRLLRWGMTALVDDAPESILRFYLAYRAMVRAKVHSMRAHQLRAEGQPQNEEEFQKARRYVLLGERFMSEGVAAERDRPLALFVVGAMGSGKSTLARQLSQELCCTLLQTDVLRGELFEPEKNRSLTYGEGKYSATSRLAVYELMTVRMKEALKKGMSVVLDGSFSDPKAVKMVTTALLADQTPYVFFHCQVPTSVAQARIAQRVRSGHSESEARPELVQDQRSQGDWDFSQHPTLAIDGRSSVRECVQRVLDFLDEGKGWKKRFESSLLKEDS